MAAPERLENEPKTCNEEHPDDKWEFQVCEWQREQQRRFQEQPQQNQTPPQSDSGATSDSGAASPFSSQQTFGFLEFDSSIYPDTAPATAGQNDATNNSNQ